MAKLLLRKRVLAFKAESSEGTAETLAAADATVEAYDPRVSFDVPYFRRTPARSSLTPLEGLAGQKRASLSFGVELKGSGAAATPPGFDELLEACGFQQIDPWKLTGGTITGTFQAGEQVTQATSGAKGIVMFDAASSETLWLAPVSGTFNTVNVVTGDTSGATVTPTGAVQGVAVAYRPNSGSSVPSLTLGGYFDGVRHLLAGCRGNVQITGSAGEIARLNFEFRGVHVATQDVAILTAQPDGTKPPVFLGVSLEIQNAYKAIFQQLTVNMQNEVVERPDAGADNGVLSYLITGRAPQMTVDPEMETVAIHDFVGKLRAGTSGRGEFSLGSATGNRVRVGMANIQYVQLSDDDRSGLSVAGLTLDLSDGVAAQGDGEVYLLFD